MKSVAWDDEAIADLNAIADFISKDSKRAAAKVVTYIRDRALLLETSPELGRVTPDGRFRELVLSRFPYILLHTISDDEVRIVAVFHHSQKRR